MNKCKGLVFRSFISSFVDHKRKELHSFSVPSIEIDKDEEAVSSILSMPEVQSLPPEKITYLERLVRFVTCSHLQGLPLPDAIEGNYHENVSFEWRSDTIDEVIVTFKPNGDLVYSGVFKTGSICGVEKFNGTNIPDVIKTALLRTVSNL